MTNRIAIVAGATGLVGGRILAGLLADPGVAAVHSIGRKALPIQHPKLTAHIVDFAALPALPAADEVYVALGTCPQSHKGQFARMAFRTKPQARPRQS